MRRSLSRAALWLVLGTALVRPACAQALGDPPANVLANVYSHTAAGLRWDRRYAEGERYEVRRDGEVVAITEGTSHVAIDLSPDRPYLFEVIAIDRQGMRSPSVRLSLSTRAGSLTPPVMAGPAAPSGLRAVAYSPTAGAVSWTRPSVPGLRYDVRRDGHALARTDGTSHIDHDLAGGRSYRYAVRAIDPSGRRSVESFVVLETPVPALPRLADIERPDAAAASGYARLGAARTVELARRWLAGPPFELLGSAQAVMERLENDLRDAIALPDEGTPYESVCADGGRATTRFGYPFSRHEFHDCRTDGLRLFGKATRFAHGGPNGLGETVGFIYDDLLVIESGSGSKVLATGREERYRGDRSDPPCRSAGSRETLSRDLVDTVGVVDGTKTRFQRYEVSSSSTRETRDTGSLDDFGEPICTTTRSVESSASARVTTPLLGGRAVSIRGGSSAGELPLHVRFDEGTVLDLYRRGDGTGNLQLDVEGDGTMRSHTLRDDG